MEKEERVLKDVLGSFIDSYAERDKSIAFSEWLESRLRQEMPDISKEMSEQLAGDIIKAVASYDKTLSELNEAIDAGQSKEEWFAERMAENYAGMPPDEAGKRLQIVERGYTEADLQLIQKLDTTQQEAAGIPDEGSDNWNEYSLKDKTYQIGKKIGLAGVAVAANAIKYNMESTEPVDLKDAVGEALKEGVKTNPEEVKAAVAGAVKVAAVKGLTDALPSGASTETICDMAGAAVEGAEALFDAANGEINMTEALDKVGRAGVAAGCRCCGDCLKGYLLSLPCGPLLVDLLGGLLDHMAGPKFADNVYHVVRDAAVATWEGIKESGKKMLHGLTNLKNIFAAN